MELMIKGTSALVSVPSQWVKQVAPLPGEKGGMTRVIPTENPGRTAHLLWSLRTASLGAAWTEEEQKHLCCPRSLPTRAPGDAVQTQEKGSGAGLRRGPGDTRARALMAPRGRPLSATVPFAPLALPVCLRTTM